MGWNEAGVRNSHFLNASRKMNFLIGFLIAAAVGLTGIGGGSFTVPALMLIVGLTAGEAVGTAFLFAGILRLIAAPFYLLGKQIHSRYLWLLLQGAVPGLLVGIWALRLLNRDAGNPVVVVLLGVVLATSSSVTFVRRVQNPTFAGKNHRWLPWLALPIGMESGFSSAGAGALGTVLLLNYSEMTPAQVVGTDLLFGLVLAVIGSAFHWTFGSISTPILFQLLLGGVPGVVFGCLLARRVPANKLKTAVAMVAIFAGLQLVWTGSRTLAAKRSTNTAKIGRVETMFEDYQQAVTNYRKDVANGRKGGIKRYIWQSTKNFSEELQSAEKQRGEEADAVALLLLQRCGFNPGIALAAADKMDLLLGGGGANGWQAGMTEVLCSTHPDWVERIQKTQMNLNCLQSSGKLCENHTTFPVENFLSQLHEGTAQLDSYREETVRIAEGESSSAQIFQAEVKVDPKDAALQVDGQPVSPGTLQLPVGPHTLSVTRDGYRQQEQQITIFPDVQPKVKIKLKKL